MSLRLDAPGSESLGVTEMTATFQSGRSFCGVFIVPDRTVRPRFSILRNARECLVIKIAPPPSRCRRALGLHPENEGSKVQPFGEGGKVGVVHFRDIRPVHEDRMTARCFSYLTMCIHRGNGDGLHFSKCLNETGRRLFRSKTATGRGKAPGLVAKSLSDAIKSVVTDLFATLNALDC